MRTALACKSDVKLARLSGRIRPAGDLYLYVITDYQNLCIASLYTHKADFGADGHVPDSGGLLTTKAYHNCDSTAIRLRHDYDEKLTCSFFARVESRRKEAARDTL